MVVIVELVQNMLLYLPVSIALIFGSSASNVEDRADYVSTFSLNYQNSSGSPTFLGADFSVLDIGNGSMGVIFGEPNARNSDEELIGETHLCLTTLLDTPTGTFNDIPLDGCKKLNVNDRSSDSAPGSDGLGMGIFEAHADDDRLVCAQRRSKVCTGFGGGVTLPGDCYQGNPLTNSWNSLTVMQPSCFADLIDIILLVDGSGSIDAADFSLAKEWLVNVTDYLHNRFGSAIRTEVLQFSNKDGFFPAVAIGASTKFKIPYVLNDDLSSEERRNRIRAMSQLGETTYTYYALRRATEWEFRQSERYDSSKKVIVVITDGEATDSDDLPRWWDNYGKTGIVTPYAVGIGEYLNFYDQLRTIANGGANGGKSNERVYTVDDFLQLSTIFSELTESITSNFITEGQSNTLADDNPANDIANSQMGSSMAVLEDGSIHVSLVGMYKNSGAVTNYDNSNDESPVITSYESIKNALPDYTTDSYLGYAMTSGYFNGNLSSQYIAVGAPRYKLKGAVVVYKPVKESYMVESVTIHPYEDQVAAYFGSCLLSADVNNDGFDDLFVASPMFVGDNYEEGRVFFYLSQGNKSVLEWASTNFTPTVLSGDESMQGRFGSAMAVAGDLNLDGYIDVVIGNPLSDEGKGSVYIYNGAKNGISNTPSQVIQASQLSRQSSLEYFGQSIYGNIFIGKEEYPAILVGAPKSGSLTLLRMRPIVRIDSELDFSTRSIDVFQCKRNGHRNCATLTFCLRSHGTSLGNTTEIVFNLTLDFERRTSPRAVFNLTSTNQISRNATLITNNQTCRSFVINLLEDAADFESRLSAKLEFDLSADHSAMERSSVLDRTFDKSNLANITWVSECGDLCSPDLGVSARIAIPEFESDNADLNTTLVVTETTTRTPVKIEVNVTNQGGESLSTTLKLSYPSQVSLSDVTTDSSSSDCVTVVGLPAIVGAMKEQFFKYYDNVMPANSWCVFEIKSDFEKLREEATRSTFDIRISISSNSSVSIENDTVKADNVWEKSIPIRYLSDLDLRRETSDAFIQFNNTATGVNFSINSIKEIGENTSDVDIRFKIEEKGHSNIPLSEISLTFPSYIDDRHPVLYPFKLECSTSDSETTCTCDHSAINRHNLRISEDTQNASGSSNGSYEVIPLSTTFEPDRIECPTNTSDSRHACETLKCTISNLRSSAVYFEANFRLWTESIKSIFNKPGVDSIDIISTFGVSISNSSWYIGSDGKTLTFLEEQVATTAAEIIPEIGIAQNDNLLTIILCSAGGALVFAAIIFFMWKCGFFKSNKPPEQSLEDSEYEETPPRKGVSVEDSANDQNIYIGDNQSIECYCNSPYRNEASHQNVSSPEDNISDVYKYTTMDATDIATTETESLIVGSDCGVNAKKAPEPSLPEDDDEPDYDEPPDAYETQSEAHGDI